MEKKTYWFGSLFRGCQIPLLPRLLWCAQSVLSTFQLKIRVLAAWHQKKLSLRWVKANYDSLFLVKSCASIILPIAQCCHHWRLKEPELFCNTYLRTNDLTNEIWHTHHVATCLIGRKLLFSLTVVMLSLLLLLLLLLLMLLTFTGIPYKNVVLEQSRPQDK